MLELCCFICVIWPSQLSCLSSSVGRAFVENAECYGSQARVMPEVAHISLK